MDKERKIEVVRQTLGKYLNHECLKPEWDGMTLWEISSIVLRELEKAEMYNSPDFNEEEYGKLIDGHLKSL